MTISIAARLRPFSHLPGISCLIPGTPYEAEIFPNRIHIYDLSTSSRNLVKEFSFSFQGPIREFTVLQDLERGCITIFGKNLPQYHLLPNLEISTKKHPPLPPLMTQERLSLGSHKKQEWEELKKRRDFIAIFPLWLRLGMLLPASSECPSMQGMWSLVEACKEATQNNKPEHILPAFERLFLAGFKGILVPRLQDDEYQGLVERVPLLDTPLTLLKASSVLIRSLFVRSHEDSVALLPALPPEFFAGRIVQWSTPYGSLSMEWTKKTLRQLKLYSTFTGKATFHFPPQLRDFRVRMQGQDTGKRYSCRDLLEINSGSVYLLDQFQK